jgi:bifunctional N-acetylglucosamine-1-phosphate-uridyltransferase/glucosamine-1-phosphate-acetyltransferase GlmU-like protein
MKLSKAYNSDELCMLIGATCDEKSQHLFETISTLSNPLPNSLGFLTAEETKEDLSLFDGLLVSDKFSQNISNDIQIFKCKNVMRAVSRLLETISTHSGYTLLENYNNVFVGHNVTIGKDCIIYPGVFLNHNTSIGDNVIIHPNAVIGSDGFGLYKIDGRWQKVPHVGAVIIEDNVEIGSGTTVDRGLIDNTVLKNNCKIDNLVHIAHNVTIGENTAIAACTGIAGSTVIGSNCSIGGGTGINGHISICNNVHIHGMSTITKSIKSEGQYASAMAADSVRNWRRNQVLFRNLYKKNR